MKTKLLKNEEDVLFYAWTLTLFLFFSRTRCPTEVVSSRSNTYYCQSVCNDRRLFPALQLAKKNSFFKSTFFWLYFTLTRYHAKFGAYRSCGSIFTLILSRDITWWHGQRRMCLVGRWEPLTLSHHRTNPAVGLVEIEK